MTKPIQYIEVPISYYADLREIFNERSLNGMIRTRISAGELEKDTVTMPQYIFEMLTKKRKCPRCGYLEPESPEDTAKRNVKEIFESLRQQAAYASSIIDRACKDVTELRDYIERMKP
jgi:hypothetical protein